MIRSGWHILSALAAIVLTMAADAALAAPRDGGAPPPGPRAAPALPSSGAQSEPIDLNEGKSPAEMFTSGCAVCHQRPQGLAKGRSAKDLAGFLRQHYTSGTQQAGAIAGYLTSGGLERGTPTPARATPAGTEETPAASRRTPARPGDIAAPEGASAQNRNRRPAPAAETGPDGVIYLPPGATEVPDDAGRRRDAQPAAPAAAPPPAARTRPPARPTETARPAEPARPHEAPRPAAEADTASPPATSAVSPPAEDKPAPPARDNIPL